MPPSIIRLAVLFLTLSTVASTEPVQKGDPDQDPFFGRITFFAGPDLGYTFVSTDDANEIDKDGLRVDVKGLLSYSWTDWSLEGGLGWAYHDVGGNSSAGPVLEDDLTMKSGFAQIGGRFRITPQWEIGLRNEILFGADTRFQTTMPQEDHVNWLMGPEVVYRLPVRYPVQFTGTLLTDLTISSRQVLEFFFGAQIGFPVWGSPRKAPTPEPTPAPMEPPPPSPTPTPEPTAVPVPVVEAKSTPIPVYILELRSVEFDTNSAKLRPRSRQFLTELGTFLAGHPDVWEKIAVSGHTDRRGSYEYNLVLSQKRADAVRSALVERGVNSESITAKGYSYSRPRAESNSRAAYQSNRRVELRFERILKPDIWDPFVKELGMRY